MCHFFLFTCVPVKWLTKSLMMPVGRSVLKGPRFVSTAVSSLPGVGHEVDGEVEDVLVVYFSGGGVHDQTTFFGDDFAHRGSCYWCIGEADR